MGWQDGVCVGGMYRHYKTKNVYAVIAVAQNTGDAFPNPPPMLMVVYYGFEQGRFFTRPLTEFLATVPHAEGLVQRFELVKSS